MKLHEAASLKERLARIAKVDSAAKRIFGSSYLDKSTGHGITQGCRAHPDRDVISVPVKNINRSKVDRFVHALKKAGIPTGDIQITPSVHKGVFELEVNTDPSYFSVPIEQEIEFWKDQGESPAIDMWIDRLNNKRLADVDTRRKNLKVVK